MSNVRLTTVKESSQLPKFDGVDISFQIMDGNIEAIVISQDDKLIRIVKNGTYTDYLKVLVNVPQEYKTRYKASYTTWDDEERSKVFESEKEAKSWLSEADVKGVIEEFKELVEPPL